MTAEYELSPSSLRELRRFIGKNQLQVMLDAMKGEEGESFYMKFDELLVTLNAMPKTYDQDGLGENAIVHLHYFAGGSSDWWITERDKGDPENPRDHDQHQAFGFADPMGDPHCAEFGYISIVEILECGAELDLHWQPITVAAAKARKYPVTERVDLCALCKERPVPSNVGPVPHSDVCLDCQQLLRWLEL